MSVFVVVTVFVVVVVIVVVIVVTVVVVVAYKGTIHLEEFDLRLQDFNLLFLLIQGHGEVFLQVFFRLLFQRQLFFNLAHMPEEFLLMRGQGDFF